MKLAIPMANGKLAAHFGHCQMFALIDVENNEITNTEFLIPPPHEPGILPKWLSQQGTTIVIAGGMGHRAVDLFNQEGITVVTGAPSETPETLVKQYLNNTLATGDNLCAGGGLHQCDH